MRLMQDFSWLSIEPTRLSKPSIGEFNNPAFGQDDESLGFVRAEDNFQRPRKMLFDPVKKIASIAAISPDNGESLAYFNDFGEEQKWFNEQPFFITQVAWICFPSHNWR